MVSVSNPSYFSESNHELRQSVLLGEASNSLFLTHALYSLDSTFFIGFVHLAILIFTNIGLIHINTSLLIYQNILNSLCFHIFQLLSSTKQMGYTKYSSTMYCVIQKCSKHKFLSQVFK